MAKLARLWKPLGLAYAVFSLVTGVVAVVTGEFTRLAVLFLLCLVLALGWELYRRPDHTPADPSVLAAIASALESGRSLLHSLAIGEGDFFTGGHLAEARTQAQRWARGTRHELDLLDPLLGAEFGDPEVPDLEYMPGRQKLVAYIEQRIKALAAIQRRLSH